MLVDHEPFDGGDNRLAVEADALAQPDVGDEALVLELVDFALAYVQLAGELGYGE